MTRIQKKCLIASAGLHGLLVLVIAFGAAFQPRPKQLPQHRINVVPSRLVDSMLAGGGGNPNLPRTEEMVRGNTLEPIPPTPPAPKPPEPKPPLPKPPAPQPEPVRNSAKPTDQPRTKPVETSKPTVTPTPTPPKLDLVPTVRTDAAKVKAQKEAEAREVARAQAERQRLLANALGKAQNNVVAGFQNGTQVEVGGPGGEAYANYSLLVEAAYRDAIQAVTDLSDRDFTVKVEVVIARSGRVMLSRIVRRSSNPVMDRAVQRALDKVQSQGLPPFPTDAKDSERKFTIDYSFRARKATG